MSWRGIVAQSVHARPCLGAWCDVCSSNLWAGLHLTLYALPWFVHLPKLGIIVPMLVTWILSVELVHCQGAATALYLKRKNNPNLFRVGYVIAALTSQ